MLVKLQICSPPKTLFIKCLTILLDRFFFFFLNWHAKNLKLPETRSTPKQKHDYLPQNCCKCLECGILAKFIWLLFLLFKATFLLLLFLSLISRKISIYFLKECSIFRANWATVSWLKKKGHISENDLYCDSFWTLLLKMSRSFGHWANRVDFIHTMEIFQKVRT